MEAAGQKDLLTLSDRQDVEECTSEQEERQLLDGDLWDDLTEEDKDLLVQSEQECSQQSFFLNLQLLKRYEEWKVD